METYSLGAIILLKFKQRYIISGKHYKRDSLQIEGASADSKTLTNFFTILGYKHREHQDRASESFEVIFKKMFEMVGADYNNFDFNSDGWTNKYTWSRSKEQEFEKWLIDYLYNSTQARREICSINIRTKRYIRRVVSEGIGFMFNYGWHVPLDKIK